MFGFKKKSNEVMVVGQKKKKNLFKRAYAAMMAACMIAGSSAISVSAAEEGASVSSITSESVSTVTTTMGSIWNMITGNAYLSFAVGVSVILAVIMIFKRLIGASRR